MKKCIESGALERAKNSVKCLPFKKQFYEEIKLESISSKDLCKRSDWNNIVFVPFGIKRAEEHFSWMIKLGILRREVDGQGLTDRVILTPLGLRVIEQFEGEIPRAGIRERIKENFRRHTV